MPRDYVSEYFGDLSALRTATGLTDASEVPDGDLTTACTRAGQVAEGIMKQRGYARSATMRLHGNGLGFLELPEPLYTLTSVGKEIDDGTDTELWVANDDYRAHDITLELDGGWDSWRLYPRLWRVGAGNVWQPSEVFVIVGTWGMVDEDGAPPEDLLHALARMTVLSVGPAEDEDAMERRRLGAIQSKHVGDRIVDYAPESAAASSLVGESWVLDTLRRYRLPNVRASACARQAT